MSLLMGISLTLLSLCSISIALPDFHTQMSPQQLQSVFHVDSIAAVPHYEVVQLLHHHSKHDDALSLTTPSKRRRRSINIDPEAGTNKSSSSSSSSSSSHHVKKDLSKNPYFSKLKEAAVSANSVSQSDSKEKMNTHNNIIMDVRNIKEHNVSFSAFGEKLNLTLRATQGLFKDGPHKLRMWTVRSEPNATHGLDMQEVSDEDAHTSEEIGELFQDEANLAAILMRRHLETGDLIMEGSIGHGLVIKPLPHELSPHKDRAHHIIYKRETSSLDHMGDFAFMEPDDVATSQRLEKLQKRKRRSVTMADLTDELALDGNLDDAAAAAADSEMPHKRSKRLAPNIIYPEVLVIVDYDGYRLHGGDNLQVKRYFISFWNGVDLRYRLLKGPRIRISIAGIIISRGRDATPYLERNRVGRDAIDSAAALTDMGKYLFRERRLPVYDIAVAITKYDMCRRRKGGRCTKGTAGFAYVGGACVVNKRLEKVNSVAIIEDTGGFSGIIVAAHEVGHLLGAVHDGSPPPSYLGGPGAQRCRWEDGYIMSDLRHTERGFRWSPCTVQSFHHFLNGDTATCLHNAPHEDSALGRSLPGSLLSLDAQCRRDRGTYACFKDQRVCAQLFCFDAQTGYCVAYRPAAEGSSCGSGLNCLDGRCQPQSINAIPDFGKQFRAYNNAEDEDDEEDEADNETDSNEEDDPDKDDDNEDEDENDNVDDNEEEEGEDEDVNGSKNPIQDALDNALQNLRKFDNSIEETSLKITDNKAKTPLSATTTKTRPTTAPTSQTTTTTPTSIVAQKSLDTLEYLTRFLDDKDLWQQYLLDLVTKTTESPIKQTITTPTTLLTPSTIHHVAPQTTPKTTTTPSTSVTTTPADQPITSIKKSTNTSTSSRSRGTKKHNNNNYTNRSSFQNSSTHKNGSNNNQFENNSSREKQLNTHTTKLQEQQKLKPQQKHNTLKLHATDFRKQFQYYLSLLQKQNSSSSNSPTSYSSIDSNKKQLQQQRTTKQQLFQKQLKNSNYSETNANSNNNNIGINDINEHQLNGSSDDEEADNVESNEAIERRNRKADIALTAAVQLQQQQQHFAATSPTTITPTRNQYGARSTPRTHAFFDAYFKKLQAINAQQQQQQQQQQNNPLPPTAITATSVSSTSSVVTSSTSSSSSSSPAATTDQQRKPDAPSSYDHFGGHFLKLVNWKVFPF